jgi:hypothetical protein
MQKIRKQRIAWAMPWGLLPYGGWECADGTWVIFDRHYRPIVRIPDGPDVIAVDAYYQDGPREPIYRRVLLPWKIATACRPDELIEFDWQFFFYDGDRTHEVERSAEIRDLITWISIAVTGVDEELRRRWKSGLE